MQKPQSIKTQPWTQFKRQPYFFINEEYPHQKLIVAKIAQKIAKSTLNLKSTLDRKKQNLKHTDDLKFWFSPKEGKHIYVRIKDDYLKLQYDNGITQPIKGHNYNFYGSFQSKRSLRQKQLKLGACFISNSITCNNRIKFDKFDSGFSQLQTTYYHKSQYLKDSWKFALYGAFNFNNKMLVKNGLLIGKSLGGAEYFLRAYKDWKEEMNYKDPKDYFSTVTFDYVRKISDQLKVGVQVDLYSQGETLNGASAAFEKNYPQENATLKGRFTSDLKFALSLKRNIGSYGSTSFGIEVGDIGKTNNVSYGVQIDINL